MKKGLFLEMLVECLHKLLVSDGITVNRNEKFYSKRTGIIIGEVDIVLRGKIGSVDVMVGIECRDRRALQGRPWIQQIIGRKDDLAEFGFNHWIAVSSSGFTTTAEELAKKANIPLLVPGKAVPVEPSKGVPDLMQWRIGETGWSVKQLKAKIEGRIEYEDQTINKLENKSWKSFDVGHPGMKLIPINDFMKPMAEPFFEEIKPTASKGSFRTSHTFKFSALEGLIDGLPFKMADIEMLVDFYDETFYQKFRMMGFAIPNSNNVLNCIVGVNEYVYRDEIHYMMIAFNPKEPDKRPMVLRDSEGKPFAGRTISFIVPDYPPDTPIRMVEFNIS